MGRIVMLGKRESQG